MTDATQSADTIHARAFGLAPSNEDIREIAALRDHQPSRDAVIATYRQGLEFCHQDWETQFKRANDAEMELDQVREELQATRFVAVLMFLCAVGIVGIMAWLRGRGV